MQPFEGIFFCFLSIRILGLLAYTSRTSVELSSGSPRSLGIPPIPPIKSGRSPIPERRGSLPPIGYPHELSPTGLSNSPNSMRRNSTDHSSPVDRHKAGSLSPQQRGSALRSPLAAESTLDSPLSRPCLAPIAEGDQTESPSSSAHAFNNDISPPQERVMPARKRRSVTFSEKVEISTTLSNGIKLKQLVDATFKEQRQRPRSPTFTPFAAAVAPNETAAGLAGQLSPRVFPSDAVIGPGARRRRSQDPMARRDGAAESMARLLKSISITSAPASSSLPASREGSPSSGARSIDMAALRCVSETLISPPPYKEHVSLGVVNDRAPTSLMPTMPPSAPRASPNSGVRLPALSPDAKSHLHNIPTDTSSRRGFQDPAVSVLARLGP
jgi:hypothetical protein